MAMNIYFFTVRSHFKDLSKRHKRCSRCPRSTDHHGYIQQRVAMFEGFGFNLELLCFFCCLFSGLDRF